MQRLFAGAAALATTLLAYAEARALTLSDADTRALNTALGNIAGTGGASDRATADAILSNAAGRAYTAEHYRGYFAQNTYNLPFSPALEQYLLDCLLDQPGSSCAATRGALQPGFSLGVTDSLITFFFLAAWSSGTGTPVPSNPTLMERASYLLNSLSQVVVRGAHVPASRPGVYAGLKQIVSSYPQLLRSSVALDSSGGFSPAFVREKLFGVMWEAADFSRTGVATDLGLNGRYADILNQHGVLVLDNSSLDAAQLEFLYDMYNKLTAPRVTRALSVIDFIRGSGGRGGVFDAPGGFNTFANRITGPDSFPGPTHPSELPSTNVPIFCSAAIHEMAHSIDQTKTDGTGPFAPYFDARFVARKDELIQRAGSKTLEYHRSEVTTGDREYFIHAPQEFFASLTNHTGLDTRAAFKLAQQRFERGFREPIHQLLLVAEAFSKGTSSTPLYRVDANTCAIAVTNAPLTRDTSGRINGMTIDGDSYRFTLDASGNVTAITAPAAVRVRNGELIYEAAAAKANRVALGISGSNVTLTDSAVSSLTASTGCTRNLFIANQVTCPLSSVKSVRILTGDLNDTVTSSLSVPSVMVGGPGDDSLSGGPGVDRLIGGAGIDTLNGGAGADLLFGDSGADTFNAGAGADLIYAIDGARDTTIQCGPDSDNGSADSVDAPNADCEAVLRGQLTTTSLEVPSGAIDLSQVGGYDWAHFGLDDWRAFNHKAGAVWGLENWEPIWNGRCATFLPTDASETPGLPSFGWTDGTPIATQPGTSKAMTLIDGNPGQGFRLPVAADENRTRTIKVWLSALAAQGHLEVSLNDESAPPVTIGMGLSTNQLVSYAFTFSYRSATPYDHLWVRFTQTSAPVAGTPSKLILHAAALNH